MIRTAAQLDADKLRAGIKGYAHERAVMLRLLPFTSEQFDRWFRGGKAVTNARTGDTLLVRRAERFRARRGSDFMLGGFMPTRWSENLELLQIMAAIGDVVIERVGELIVYRKS